ncbi:MAG: OmpA family protein [Syntrophaceae bacterium]|nr:OmpA family protein [Syntrophaceae bacterium]
MPSRFGSPKLFFLIQLMILGGFSITSAESEFKDTPYFSGMPNYRITDASDLEFSDYRFYNGEDCTTVEGKKHFRTYALKEGAKQASELQISRNYSNSIKGMGGTIIFDGECSGANCAENCGGRMLIGKVIKGGSELWVEVAPFNDGNDYYLTVIVKQAMKQDVTASNMLEALNRDGHIALYLNFDTGKATMGPEAQTIIAQIAEMLKANPGLKVSVEGHTDNVGTPASNKTLSNERAKTVVAAIIAQGIDANRLSAVGHGQDKPIADNKTEEGRARNRRVELVKK